MSDAAKHDSTYFTRVTVHRDSSSEALLKHVAGLLLSSNMVVHSVQFLPGLTQNG